MRVGRGAREGTGRGPKGREHEWALPRRGRDMEMNGAERGVAVPGRGVTRTAGAGRGWSRSGDRGKARTVIGPQEERDRGRAGASREHGRDNGGGVVERRGHTGRSDDATHVVAGRPRGLCACVEAGRVNPRELLVSVPVGPGSPAQPRGPVGMSEQGFGPVNAAVLMRPGRSAL